MLKISAVVLVAATLSLVMARKPHTLKKTNLMGPVNTLEEIDNLPEELDRSFMNDIAEVYDTPMSSKNNLNFDRVTKILSAVLDLVKAIFGMKRSSDSINSNSPKGSLYDCDLSAADKTELKDILSKLVTIRSKVMKIHGKCQNNEGRKSM